MIILRKAQDRGLTKLSWLESYHSFSFGDYEDSDHINFQSLRVLNEDTVAAGQGFGAHSHHDVEIMTYVIEGALLHQDSMGNEGKITPGMIQMISAGNEVTHSEYNASSNEPVHFLQIWIRPNIKSVTSQYLQKSLYLEDYLNRLCLLVSPDGKNQSLAIKQDAQIFLCELTKSKKIRHAVDSKRSVWLQIIKGEVLVSGITVQKGDGAAITQVAEVVIEANEDSEFLLFDLA